MIYGEDLLGIVLWLSLVVVCLDVCFVIVVLLRRSIRRNYFRRKDSAHSRFAPIVKQVLVSSISANVAVEKFRKVSGRAERDAICELLSAALTPENRDRVTDLLIHLGFVERWIRQAFGRKRAGQLIAHLWGGAPLMTRSEWHARFFYRWRFLAVSRAEAVQQLGKLSPECSDLFIEEAKADPSPEVRRVNIASMGRTGSALSYLLPELESAVEERNGIAVRTIKAAIVRAEIDDPNILVGYLKHSNERVRFLVVDSIREICGKPRPEPLSAENFPEAMYQAFLEHLVRDRSIDVRARSAAVIRHFHDRAATDALNVLMRDENEFVRLHAVRACADAYYSALVPDIAERLSDTRWRVREAAVKTLSHLGTRGMRAIAETFLSTNDCYATEQIAEELQRSGAILDIIETLDSGTAPSKMASALCRKMIALGRTSFLAEMLGKHHSFEKRARLMDLLASSQSPYTKAVLGWIASRPDDPLAHQAEVLLQQTPTVSAEAGGN